MIKQQTIVQIGLVAVAIIALFALYFFGKTSQPISLQEVAESASGQQIIAIDVEELILQARENLTEEEKTLLRSSTENNEVAFWQSIDRNDIAALTATKLAEQNGSFERWNNAGDLSIRAFREVTDSTQKAYFVQESVSSYEKALEYQQDITTKLKLAKTHTSLTGATMQGVLLLREIVEEEPKHVQANYELGLLSLQSGQDEKAMQRFDLLIKEEPQFIEPYILKAQLLISQQKTEEAKNVIDAAIANTEDQNGLQVLQEMKKRIK